VQKNVCQPADRDLRAQKGICRSVDGDLSNTEARWRAADGAVFKPEWPIATGRWRSERAEGYLPTGRRHLTRAEGHLPTGRWRSAGAGGDLPTGRWRSDERRCTRTAGRGCPGREWSSVASGACTIGSSTWARSQAVRGSHQNNSDTHQRISDLKKIANECFFALHAGGSCIRDISTQCGAGEPALVV
jgi:hypothetical protein